MMPKPGMSASEKREWMRRYMRKYSKRPLVMILAKAKRAEYLKRPEVAERMKKYQEGYSRRPEVIARRHTPEGRARACESTRRYYAKNRKAINERRRRG